MESNKRTPRYHYQRRKKQTFPVCKTGGDVPAWEKRFCLVVGRMKWKDLLRCKESVDSFPGYYHKVVDWDDSAGLDYFRFAKARFFAAAVGRGGNCRLPPTPLPSPDSLLDDVVWGDPNVDEEERRLVAEIEEAEETAWRLAAAQAAAEEEILGRSIPLEEIKATGWDDEGCDEWKNPTLTGMIVGGDDCDREFSKGGRNCEDNGAENRNRGKSAAADNCVNAHRRQVYWRRIPNNVAF